MTILVGIRCADGIVIAADQQATRGAAGQPTVGSPVTKVTALKNNSALFAFSGFTGLGQQIGFSIESTIVLTNRYSAQHIGLQNAACTAIHPAITRAKAIKDILPNAVGEAICGCLLGAKFSDGLHLIEITPSGSCDLVDPMKWACVGSGMSNADTFLSFLWSVYWHDRDPTLQEAVVTAYWVVANAIASKAPGVGFEVDVFVLAPDAAGIYKTRQLSQAELEEPEEFIGRVEAAMKAIRDQMIPEPQNEAADEADEPPIAKPEGTPGSTEKKG